MIENYGGERVWMNSACDWGVTCRSLFLMLRFEMRKRGYVAEQIDKMIFQNPARFMSQSAKFKSPTS